MILNTNTLPSKGLTTAIREINLLPMNYQEILDYNAFRPEEELDKEIHEIEGILGNVPNYGMLSAYDLKMLIFTRKWISATFDPNIIVPINGYKYTINVGDITFKDIDKTDLMQITSVTLNSGTYPFVIPSIDQYLKTLRFLVGRNIKTDRNTAMLISSLDTMNDTDRIAWAIHHAESDEIVALRRLCKTLCDPVNDVTVRRLDPMPTGNMIITDKVKGKDGNIKEVSVVDINASITDMFRFLESNSKSSTEKIINKKEVGN